jgi:hypothetical protein
MKKYTFYADLKEFISRHRVEVISEDKVGG